MADTEEESDLDRSEITTRESLSATSSLESPSSPRSVDSDWSFPGRQDSDELSDGASGRHGGVTKQSSIVDCLLFEIYDHYHARYSVDSDNVTECSTASGSVFGGSSFDFEESRERWTKSSLQSKGNSKPVWLVQMHSIVPASVRMNVFRETRTSRCVVGREIEARITFAN